MNLFKFFVLISVIPFITACSQLSPEIETTPTVDLIAAAVQATLSAAEEITPTLPSMPSVRPAWLEDDSIPTGPTLPPFLAGLTFRDDQVWLVDQAGTSRRAVGQPVNGVLSPDATGFLYASSMNEGEDIFYYNIAAGRVSQWTSTPDTYESGFQWWPARPDTIVFNFVPAEENGPWYGYIGAFNITNSEYIIIDGEYGSGSTFALSPDGERIAFNQASQPVIYTWGQGTVEIDLASLGLNFQSYSSPAWSPDGGQIAYHAAGGGTDPNSGAILNATVIYDLAPNTAQVLHQYSSYGQRGGPEIAWSPDGEWLAVVNPGEIDANGDPMAMWLLNTTSEEEIFMGYSSGPIWSPDGEHLIFTTWNSVGSTDPHKIYYVENGVWEPTVIDELEGSFLAGWIDLPAK